jgi:nucleotide-binding universal stress UspA family protein
MKVEFKRILCATDLSDFSNMSVFYGAALARVYEAELFVCHVVDLPIISVHGEAFAYPPDYVDNLKTDATEKMESLMADLAVPWKTLVRSGAIAHTLAGLVENKGIDLLVAATHGRSGLTRLLLGSVTERLIRIVPCPILIVTPPEKTIDGTALSRFRFKRILVGCDFSGDSSRAVDYGFSLAQEFESELHLVHVMEPFAYMDTISPVPVTEEVQSTLTTNLTARLEALVPDDARNWCDARTICLAGKPDEELIRYAALQSADLVIMGFRGRGLVETLLLGSNTDRVLRRSDCPVLTVGAGKHA